ncbi:phytoene desaturase family protein [Ensifer adhaerens]|nr:NAD(P)/FAD-dependent oxidoreductase [Ensifer adhaerens]
MYDAIIVGAGHNGLVCGAYLAKAGLKVVNVERRSLQGGACVSEESWPGYRVSTGAYLMSLMQPKIILDLELQKHGLEVLAHSPTFVPFDDGRSIVFWGDLAKTCAEFAKFSERDAAAYPKFRQNLERLMPFVRDIIWETPLDPSDLSLKGMMRTGGFAWRYKKHADAIHELYDILTMSAFDYLSRWFESDEVITALGYYVTGGGTNRSMKMPATAFALLRPLLRDNGTPAGAGGLIRGGMGSVSDAIAQSGAKHGLEVRTGSPVEEILVSSGKVTGVRLESGEVIQGRCVISNADAKTTFLKLVCNSPYEDSFERDVKGIRTKSSIFKIHLALSKLPKFTAFSPEDRGFAYPGSIRIGTTVAYMEEAFHSHLGGHPSENPFLTIMIPSLYDETVAPPGMHLMQIMGGHAPCTTQRMSLPEMRQRLLETAIRTIARHAPDFNADMIVHSEVLTPLDLQERFGLPDGHVHHGDLTLDQTFFQRPVGGYADYRSPIDGLYLCGSAAHPGGGVTGVPGHNAAREVLRDLKKRGPVLDMLTKVGG